MTKNSNYFSSKGEGGKDGFLSELEDACRGLFYISETDSVIMPISGGAADSVTTEIVMREFRSAPKDRIDKLDVDEFFGRLTRIDDWFGEKEKERAGRFTRLRQLLTENLRDLKVFKIGRIRLDIYIVGIDQKGCLAGVTTKAVET